MKANLSRRIESSLYRVGLYAALIAVMAASSRSQNPDVNPASGSGKQASGLDSNALSKYVGKTVRDIQFRGIEGTNPEMLRRLMVQHTEEPLDPEKLRSTLKTLYATGRFATLDVEAEPVSAGGIVLTYVAKEHYFNGSVRVDGAPDKTPPKPNELVNASRLDLGETFSENDVQRGVGRINQVMADNGYYRSTVSFDLLPHDETRQMDVTFHVVPDLLARVGEIRIEGDTGIPPEKVQRVTKLKPGNRVSSDKLSRALEGLRKYYQKNHHLEAQVSLVKREYHPDSNKLDYLFKVDEGAKILIVTEGEKVPQRQLKKLVPVYQENAIDQDLLNEGRRNIRNYLQTKGYFDATVDVARHEEPSKDLVNIVYEIDPGVRHKLVAINLVGNRYFDTATIRERMSIVPASWVVENGRFSQRMLADDIANIKNLYRNNGFHDAKVEAEVVDDYAGQKGQLGITIRIVEGPQTTVNNLNLVGNKSIDTETLLPLLSSLPGQPYSEADVIADRDAVTVFYYNRGFPDIEFLSAAQPVPGNPQSMNVVYTIREGQKVDVDTVIKSGLEYTRPYVVDRAIRIHSEDPLSQVAMVASQRRLYNLGIFNQVNMAVQNPDGVEPTKNVLFDMSEAKRWTFRYGGGIEFATGNLPSQNNGAGKTGVSPNGVLEITRLNMFGRDQTLTMRGRVGLLTRRGLVSYDAPRLLRRENWRLNFSAFYDNTADVNTFASERLEGSVQAEQRYSRITTFLYRFSYRRVRVHPNSLVIDPNLIPLYSRPVRIAIPSFSMVRDRRDNPIASKRGNYNVFDAGLASSALGSQSNFGRVLVQNSTYYTVKKRWVIARSTQVGVEHPYGTNHYGSGSTAIVIPLPELFFSGGSNSLRGFSINQAGPRDPASGFPLGGQGLVVNNVELRTPPVLLPYVGDNLGFVVFHDMGNVFDTPNHILTGLSRLHQRPLGACAAADSKLPCDFNYNSQAAGLGVRYNTPVGPIRLDLSYNFNPTRYPIREQDRVTALRRVNFFFSIGQTF